MHSMFQGLSREERALFTKFMAIQDQYGQLTATADEAATAKLKNFITRDGRVSADIAARLGGQPTHGRSDILLDLIRALTGPHPIPQAWLDAMREGGFQVSEPEFYRAKGGNPAARSLGSPGTLLPRMVAQHRDNRNGVRSTAANNAALYTEAAMITTAMLLTELEQAVCAKQALGPAWVVACAVDALTPKLKRQIDALADNEDFIAALGSGITDIVAQFAMPGLEERTTKDVQHTLPPGADLDAFFAGHDERQLEAATDALVAAVERRIAEDGQPSGNASLDEAVDRLMTTVRAVPLDARELASRVAAATDYLDKETISAQDDLDTHYERLRLLMPTLASEHSPKEFNAKLILSAIFAFERSDSYQLAGDPETTAVYRGIIHRIRHYVIHGGPPPLGTPVEHIPLFELLGVALCVVGGPAWPARERWNAAKLLPKQAALGDRALECLANVIDHGLEGVAIDVASNLFS